MSRRLIFSDCHIGAGLGLESNGNNRHPWEWLRGSDQQRLLAFLKWIKARANGGTAESSGKIDEVIMLGDIFDNWIFPHDIKPPTLTQLLSSSNAAPFIAELNAISQSINTVFIPGNHDMSLSPDILRAVLPQVVHGGLGVNNPNFISGQLRAEHGNRWGLFNSPDPLKDDSLPLGYFISRIVATSDRKTGSHTPGTTQIIKELRQLITAKEEIPQGVFDAVCNKAGVKPDDMILMPDDLWAGAQVKIKDIRKRYKNLLHEFKDRNGAVATAMAIPAELDTLSIVANKLFLEGGIRAVIMGHTHSPAATQYDVPFRGKAAYVNSGSWCSGISHATWVEIEKDLPRKSKSMDITVYQCKGVDANGSLTDVSPKFPRVHT